MQNYSSNLSSSSDINDVINAERYKTNINLNENNLTLNLFTDGAKVAKSTTAQIWPLMGTVLELPPLIRFSQNNVIWCLIW